MKHEESAPQIQVGVELAELERQIHTCNMVIDYAEKGILTANKSISELAEDRKILEARREELLRGRADAKTD